MGMVEKSETVDNKMEMGTPFASKDPSALLHQCVEMTDGLSCRSLKKLPFLACIGCEIQDGIPCQIYLRSLVLTIEQYSRDGSQLKHSEGQ